MRIGDKGVKIVKPEDAGFLQKPGTDADIDTGYDDVEDYDENAVVRRKKHVQTWKKHKTHIIRTHWKYLFIYLYMFIFL